MPKNDQTVVFVRLAEELRSEVENLEKTVFDAGELLGSTDSDSSDTKTIYASGAILHTFYTGIEKFFVRLAPQLNGGLPSGPGWHRQLLAIMTRELPGVRPAVLSQQVAKELDPYLAFRHRFRNLYAFDLEWSKLRGLIAKLPSVWNATKRDLETFIAFVETLSKAVSDER